MRTNLSYFQKRLQLYAFNTCVGSTLEQRIEEDYCSTKKVHMIVDMVLC